MSKPEPFEGEDCVCSFGMKLTWDINDPKLPQDTKQFDAFQEWTDGYVRFIYNAEDKNAQRHLSGWAMRNTNNHNCQILKKSCLGVVVCSRSCTLSDGSKLQLRPAICDKARQKQQKKLCPSCNSCLELMPCRGHSGYPVTNFWRVDTKAIFFQAKGVHDHPRPESKSETEARRSAVKRRMSSPHFTTKRRLVEPEASRYDLGPTFNLHQLSCMDPPERYSTNYPLQSSHYPAFQSNYDPHNALGEAAPTLQKPANHRLFMTRPPCGYEFPVPGYLGSGSYSALSGLPYKEASSHPYREAASSPQDQLTDPSKGSSGLGSGIAPTTPHPSNSPYDSTASSKHHSWKQLLGKGSAPYGDLSAPTANHHYYSPEFPCRYPGSSNPAALQTIITTTTKVSYQPCPKPPGGLPSCSSLLEDPPSYSELKIPEDSSGVIKSAMAFQPEALPAKMERLEGYQGYDSYRYSGYQGYRYEAGEY